mmetsp:Transcript_1902/g.4214  ORF Transcript_1902/g.4214 Transcript_1902/m.4214 type:complete len:270 (+) Transcript_1902:249-1058(+)
MSSAAIHRSFSSTVGAASTSLCARLAAWWNSWLRRMGLLKSMRKAYLPARALLHSLTSKPGGIGNLASGPECQHDTLPCASRLTRILRHFPFPSSNSSHPSLGLYWFASSQLLSSPLLCPGALCAPFASSSPRGSNEASCARSASNAAFQLDSDSPQEAANLSLARSHSCPPGGSCPSTACSRRSEFTTQKLPRFPPVPASSQTGSGGSCACEHQLLGTQRMQSRRGGWLEVEHTIPRATKSLVGGTGFQTYTLTLPEHLDQDILNLTG